MHTSEIKDIFENYFLFVKECMQHHDRPTIKIPKLGEFKPSIRNIKAAVDKMEKGVNGYDSYRILNLPAVLDRIEKEKPKVRLKEQRENRKNVDKLIKN